MSSQQEFVIAVVGAGPRGTSFLERLLARVERNSAGNRRRLRVVVFDPAPHGPGRVWDPSQSPLYLMNTPASYPTAAPTASTQDALAASACSLSFLQYSHAHGPTAYDEADFPARADYGDYLAWLSREVSARLRGRAVAVDHHTEQVTGIRRDQDGYELTTAGSRWRADAVVLALGHLPAEHSAGPGHLAAQAERLGLHYQGPAIPTDIDHHAFGPGEPVLVRGMGLNFFDLMIQLTVGRGGQFRESPDAEPGSRFDYVASGQEPHLIAGSRRGTPYRAKTTAPGFVPEGIDLRHLTDQAIQQLLNDKQPDRTRQLDLGRDLWPLILKDLASTYEQFGGKGLFDVQRYARPFEGQHFATPADYQSAMTQWLEQDAATSALGRRSPEKMAVNALHAARLRIKGLVTDGLISPDSRLREVEGWFESLVEGLSSGPPLQRIEELAALARAGVVEFIGPDPVFGVDAASGTFIADSPWVQGARYTAEHLIEAMMPPNRISQAASPLVQTMLSEGLAQSARIEVAGEPHLHKGFAVTDQPHRLIDASGEPHLVYVLGLQLSSSQWGTAIAAESGGDPRTTARTLADADAAAEAMLQAATEPSG